jgi:hypothetical protein
MDCLFVIQIEDLEHLKVVDSQVYHNQVAVLPNGSEITKERSERAGSGRNYDFLLRTSESCVPCKIYK